MDAQKELAYFLWEQACKPEGRSDEFWFRAGAVMDKLSPAKTILTKYGRKLIEEGSKYYSQRPLRRV